MDGERIQIPVAPQKTEHGTCPMDGHMQCLVLFLGIVPTNGDEVISLEDIASIDVIEGSLLRNSFIVREWPISIRKTTVSEELTGGEIDPEVVNHLKTGIQNKRQRSSKEPTRSSLRLHK